MVAGVTGDGNKTGELWQDFMKLSSEIGLGNKISDNGYEIRIYSDNECICHVGVSVSDRNVNGAFTLMELPASQYAAFDVYAANGYDSENSAMVEWLEKSKNKYSQRLHGNKPYVVEFYDERFHGNDEGSIVEIWVPLEKA
jgi:predicted transcriptional regulator YdeE